MDAARPRAGAGHPAADPVSSERSLRYYEQQGLLTPKRRPSGYRDYDDDAVDTVRRIRILLAAGLGTATIAELLPCMVDNGDTLAPVCADLLPELRRERERLSRVIDELSAARAGLDRILAAPPPAKLSPQLAEQACAA
ncbi:MAG TPA: MerR family transcriptional regulator [Natronosporangium sp.]